MLWDKSNVSRLLVDSCYMVRLAKPSRVCSWGPGTVYGTECRPLVRLMYAMVFPPGAGDVRHDPVAGDGVGGVRSAGRARGGVPPGSSEVRVRPTVAAE